MITDVRLLSELDELQGTRVVEWLQGRLQVAVSGMANAPSDRLANIQAGRYQELTDILNQIETAKDEYLKQRNAPSVNMAKAF